VRGNGEFFYISQKMLKSHLAINLS
jgi:hypothetical protein